MSPGWMAPTSGTDCQPGSGVVARPLRNSSKLSGVGTKPGARRAAADTDVQATLSAWLVA